MQSRRERVSRKGAKAQSEEAPSQPIRALAPLRETRILAAARLCGSGDFLRHRARLGDAKSRNHLAQLLAGGDVGDADLAELGQVDQRQALGEQFAVDDSLAQTRDDAEADAPREFVE